MVRKTKKQMSNINPIHCTGAATIIVPELIRSHLAESGLNVEATEVEVRVKRESSAYFANGVRMGIEGKEVWYPNPCANLVMVPTLDDVMPLIQRIVADFGLTIP